MEHIDSLIKAFVAIQGNPYALGIFGICFVMLVMAGIFWMVLKAMIEAIRKEKA